MKARALLLLCLIMPLFVGCSSVKAPNGAATPEEALLARLTSLWDAKSRGDWNSVYEMTDAKYRSSIPLQKFISGAKLDIKGYTIKSITINPENPNSAFTMVQFQTTKMGQVFDLPLKERWVWEDGEWMYKLSDPVNPFAAQ